MKKIILLLLIPFFGFAQFNPIFFSAKSPLLNNLVAYYKFDSNSNDNKGVHNGSDTSISYSAGKISNSAGFNGSSSFITIPQSTDFDFSDVTADIPFSVSCWINMITQSGYGLIMSKSNTGSRQWELRKSSCCNTIELLFYGASDGSIVKYWIFPSNGLISGVWTHVAFTYDGSGLNSGLKMYINNSLATADNTNNSGTYIKMPITSQSLLMGKRGDNIAYFNGKLDEVGIWKNRILTSAEITRLYNSGNGITYPF